jgi:nitroimidazol reductase NimA-like FMN-containing flavoprotein (pyridoxamine 5'-phosphate oxidase superfamily)
MSLDALRSRIVDVLAHCDDITIATIRPDGYPQATTVSYVSDGMNIYFGTNANSQKARNLAACDKVSATVNKPYRTWDEILGVSLGGRARLLTDKAEMARAGVLMLKKFPQIGKYMPEDPGSLALFRIAPTVVSLLDYSKGFGHTDLLVVQ